MGNTKKNKQQAVSPEFKSKWGLNTPRVSFTSTTQRTSFSGSGFGKKYVEEIPKHDILVSCVPVSTRHAVEILLQTLRPFSEGGATHSSILHNYTTGDLAVYRVSAHRTNTECGGDTLLLGFALISCRGEQGLRLVSFISRSASKKSNLEPHGLSRRLAKTLQRELTEANPEVATEQVLTKWHVCG